MDISEISDFKKDELRHELRNEPPNNFQIYINGNPWKVFKGKGRTADDRAEQQQFNQLKRWASEKSASTGKKWEVSITGKPASESSTDHIPGIAAKRNPTQTYNIMGKYKVTVTKSGDSMRPVWHASIEGDDLGKFSGEKAAMQAASKWIMNAESQTKVEAAIPQKPKPYGRGNPVAKNMEKFNKPKTHADKKKEMKKRGPKISMDEAPLVVRGENNLQTMVDRALDVWLGGEKRSRQELEKVLNAIGKTIQGNGERLVIDTIGESSKPTDMDCWDGYKKQGTKPGTGKNKGKRVNNCVKK